MNGKEQEESREEITAEIQFGETVRRARQLKDRGNMRERVCVNEWMSKMYLCVLMPTDEDILHTNARNECNALLLIWLITVFDFDERENSKNKNNCC